MPKVVPVNVVILADVLVRVVTVAEVTVAFANERLEIVRLVTERFVTVPEV